MTFIKAKLIDYGKGPAIYKRTLYKIYPDDFEREKCLKIISRELPADCTELELYVNGPEKLLNPVIEMCSLRQITLKLVYPRKKKEDDPYTYTVLRYWQCEVCSNRFSASYSTCPYCGGYGFYLALPIEESDFDKFLDEAEEKVPGNFYVPEE